MGEDANRGDSDHPETMASQMEGGSRSHKRIDLVEVLLILSQRKATLLKVTLAAAVLATILSLFLPQMYTATTTILPG